MDGCYIVLSRTHTRIGAAVRLFTGYRFNHVSVSPDKTLSRIYAFARYRRSVPFMGGLVREGRERYMDEKFDTEIRVFRTETPSAALESYIAESEKYIYNHLSALCSVFHRRCFVPDSFTCVEFAAQLMGFDGIYGIRQLEEKLHGAEVYRGSFKKYLALNETAPEDGGDSIYSTRLGFFRAAKGTADGIAELLRRRKKTKVKL